jgi:L-asparaginase
VIRQELVVHRKINTNVAVLKLFPGMNRDFVNALVNTKNLQAIIMETFGAGNAPTYKWFLEEISQFISKGGLILNVTQCHGGTVEMELYETGRELLKAGVISGRDLTSEASVTKMMHLLSRFDSTDKVTYYLERSLVGEIT